MANHDGSVAGEGDDAPQSGLYRLGTNQSSASIFENVEMAHDELFSGPVAESLPTSVSAFSHRRARADSTTTFSFYNQEEEDEFDLAGPPSFTDQRPSIGDLDEFPFDEDFDETEQSFDMDRDNDAAYQEHVYLRRTSIQSRGSVASRLLHRRDSAVSSRSGTGLARSTQKVYMVNEDLYIVIAGFRTSRIGFAVYVLLCMLTLGLGWLLFRWLPRWRVKLVGRSYPLCDCDWVVVENQWKEMAILDVESKPYGRVLSSVFGTPGRMTSFMAADEDQDPILKDLRSISYRYVKFFYHPIRDKFMLCNGWKDPSWSNVSDIRGGIDSEEKTHRDVVFGSNLIDIEQKSVFRLFVDEVFHPFYVFQIASLILWSLDEYYYYASAIFFISVGSIVTTLIETKATMARLREISRFVCDVRVLRNGFWRYVSSSDLVPGDVYEISDPSLTQFPADSLLLSGDCIVNESMLTGESIPVSKIPATDVTLKRMDLSASVMLPDVAKSFLFCGTKIVRVRRPQDDQDGEAVALAMVVRTGFNTTKGALVRSMLFPKPSGFKFYRDSFRYISVMGAVAIMGFLASLVNFIRLGLAWHLIIIRALDLITIVVPPALPATLTIGTSFALSRLKRKQIFCISPQRVNVAGKLDLMCFDKTGTLTEEGLDILGVQVVSRATNQFTDLLTEPEDLAPDLKATDGNADPASTRNAALFTMATCHSLRIVDGEPVGDPLDLKMFEFTGWSFEEGNMGGASLDEDDQGNLRPSVSRPPAWASKDQADGAEQEPFELGILNAFEFVSQLRRASVIVRTFGRPSGDIYVKGAPECMRDICRPETLPPNYDELLSRYTHEGYRVIACATKHIPRLSWVKAQKMKREQVESGLDFVGFIIFENKLKPTTSAVIKELLDSNIGTVMVTGDNILTAISVARECGMIDKMAHCFVPRFLTGDAADPNASLQWESINNQAFRLDPATLLPLPAPPESDASLPYDITNLRNYSLAVTGDVFRWVIDYASPEVMRRMLVAGRVFARMSPDEKHELIEKLQSIDYSCGFCGDGANDCGALKAADVGISLSEAEASVAAPFTSRIFDIRCVPKVIREGRASLVTSFSCFKYMSLYSAIQFTSVSFLYASASNLGDFQFLFIDLALILPIAVFMSWAGPFPALCRKRPTANLVSRKVLAPLLGQMGIAIAIQAVAFVAVRQQPWYIPPVVNHDETNIKNSENTALFLTSCFEYILSGIVLNAGRPFRKSPWQNWPFVTTVVVTLAATLGMVIYPPTAIANFMELTFLSWGFKGFVVSLGVVYWVLAWFGEHWVFPGFARMIGQVKQGVFKRPKVRKQYKVILEKMAF
ncbi:hypothetical protein VTJ83DRAFT_5887 [Remersonia thermophila]|uniref:Cation-transporting ATPase n=1 Tax=Remersonia thermophila TaxID=72144 RepID=A0ABR4D8W4_9PEZI